MVDAVDVEAVVAALSDGEKRAISILPSWGFPAGHNQWPDVEYLQPDDEDAVACSGDDMNAIIRRGLVDVGERDEDGGIHLVDDDRECEARWPLDLSERGLAIHARLLSLSTGGAANKITWGQLRATRHALALAGSEVESC